jgi:hypothetical protein
MHIAVCSIMIDPHVVVGYEPGHAIGTEEEQPIYNDGSSGVFGPYAELTYRAPHGDRYFVVVTDANSAGEGGYVWSMAAPDVGDPTAVAPPPTPTPILSDFGPMRIYTSARYPFSIQYPADWSKQEVRGTRALSPALGSACRRLAEAPSLLSRALS